MAHGGHAPSLVGTHMHLADGGASLGHIVGAGLILRSGKSKGREGSRGALSEPIGLSTEVEG
eukprot:scaffold25406_cov36-Tisochrysis_lutea.AAC.1